METDMSPFENTYKIILKHYENISDLNLCPGFAGGMGIGSDSFWPISSSSRTRSIT